MDLAARLSQQKRNDSNKLYSLHAPEVECIAKGKAHKKYEFGCKVSMVSTSKDNWILGIDALHSNPYDGHILQQALNQAKNLSGLTIKKAYCDKGYRGAKNKPDGIDVHLSGHTKKLSRREKLWLKRRSAIEPIIGHVTDYRFKSLLLEPLSYQAKRSLRSFCARL